MQRISGLLVVLLLSGGWASESVQTGGREASHLLEVHTPDKGYLHFPVRILDRSTREVLTFDPLRDPPATISYSLTRDGMVRIRAVWRRDPALVLRTVLDWTRQEFGPQRVSWDGRDASGNPVDNRSVLITFEGDDPLHRKHAAVNCREPRLEIASPGAATPLADLSQVHVRISGDTPFGRVDGRTLRCYLDYRLVGEVRIDGATQSFSLPCAAALTPGEHLLTLNLDDGAGHVGIAGLRFRSGEEKPGVMAGRELFVKRGCGGCHDLESSAWSAEGPGLAHLASRRPPDFVRDVVQTPRAVNRTAAMPEDPLSEDELALMMAYLGSLERPPGPPRSGREIYRQEGCFDCHDVPSETGAMAGPHLVGIGELRSREYLEQVTLRPGEYFPRTAMPPTLLTRAELDALVSYLQDELVAPETGRRAGIGPP